MHSLPAKTKYVFMSTTLASLWKDSQQGFGPWGIVFANSIQKLRANVRMNLRSIVLKNGCQAQLNP